MRYYKLLLVLLLSILLASCSNLKTDYSKELNLTFQELKVSLLKKGFTQLPTKPDNKNASILHYTFITYNKNKYPLIINVYAKNEYANIKYIEINTEAENIEKPINSYLSLPLTKKSMYFLKPNLFYSIRQQLEVLSCSTNKDFLKSNFKCKNEYKVTGNIKKLNMLNGYLAHYKIKIFIQP